MGSLPITSLAETTPVQRSVLFSAAQTHQDAGNPTGRLESLGYTGVTHTEDKRTASGSIGYRHPLSDHWSFDVQYLDQGETNPSLQVTLPAGKTDAQAAQDLAESLSERGQGVSAVGVYHKPLGQKWVGQVGIGAYASRNEREATVNGTKHTTKDSNLSPLVQLGLSYPLTQRTRIEGHWQHFFMSGEDLDRLGLGLAIGF